MTILNVGLIDADLLDKGTRHPNIALMKISGYLKEQGNKTKLILDYNNINEYDEVYLSKVFTPTKIPLDIPEYPNKIPKKFKKYPNLKIGGTGFYFDKAPDLPKKIEHHMPDYNLYDEYINKEIARGIKPIRFSDYINYSIGFATRGCFRKCEFCVNKKYNKAFRHAPISEFFDPKRKYIYLWDDNIFAYSKWKEVFDEIAETGRYFQFRQGIDIRLMTNEKARILANSKWQGDYIFAFDHWKDREKIKKNLKLWRKYSTRTTKLYLLCAYESQDSKDIEGIFKRIEILMKYRCLPYIMRYDDYKDSEFKGMYINLARWCNQPDFFKKKSFREYCEANGLNSSTYKYMVEFEKKCPTIASKYFDMKFEEMPIEY